MSSPEKFNRRSFVKLCASAIAMVSASPRLLAAPDKTLRRYHRVRLVDANDRPLMVSDLKVGENYLFHYPFVATPCFLLNLGRPVTERAQLATEDGRRYRWEGGVGPQRSVVAFSAICAHKMTHPARQVSFINYRHQSASFMDKDGNPVRRAGVIYCCSEKSVYDPTQGARVLGGPAPQPLAAVMLEHDARDGGLYATGIYGGDLFDRFFNEFGFRLSLEFGTTKIREQVDNRAPVYPLAQYCQTQVLC